MLYPPHSTVLQLCYVPEIVPHWNLLENLRFGAPSDLGQRERVRSMFQSVSGLPNEHWCMQQLDAEIESDQLKLELDVKSWGVILIKKSNLQS